MITDVKQTQSKAERKDKLSSYTARFRLRNTLDAIDVFRKPLPTFNMRGRTSVSTICGAIVTFVIIIITLLYSTIKFVQLMSRANPLVSSFLKQGVFDSDNIANFRDKGIRFAFGIEGFLDKEMKDDTRYVKSFARFWGYKNGKSYQRIFPINKCTLEDYEAFPEPVPEAAGILEVYKSSPTRNLYCLDWDKFGDELAIWGVEDDEISYQRFEFVVVPCNYVHTEFGDIGDSVSSECIPDRDQQMEYLGNFKFVVLSTIQFFDQETYGMGAIKRRSRFETR